jgi:hypothetical protein
MTKIDIFTVNFQQLAHNKHTFLKALITPSILKINYQQPTIHARSYSSIKFDLNSQPETPKGNPFPHTQKKEEQKSNYITIE